MVPLSLALIIAALLSPPTLAVDSGSELSLEPAMNGAVSSTGAFSSQAAEDWYESQSRVARELRAEHQLALLHQAKTDAQLEPCLNGEVSPSGAFATAELETAAADLAKVNAIDLLENSAYYTAFIEGRIPTGR